MPARKNPRPRSQAHIDLHSSYLLLGINDPRVPKFAAQRLRHGRERGGTLAVAESGWTVDISGESFNNAPRAQAHISIMAPLPLDVFEQQWLNGYITPRVDWYYQSAVHFYAEAITESLQPGYSQLHARLS